MSWYKQLKLTFKKRIMEKSILPNAEKIDWYKTKILYKFQSRIHVTHLNSNNFFS